MSASGGIPGEQLGALMAKNRTFSAKPVTSATAAAAGPLSLASCPAVSYTHPAFVLLFKAAGLTVDSAASRSGAPGCRKLLVATLMRYRNADAYTITA